jgi:hypothetical protein
VAKVRTARRNIGASAILIYVGLAIATTLAGLILRLAPLGWPFWITKWGGSLLWAMMVYWLVAMVIPLRSIWTAAGISAVIAGAVELVRLYHTPGLDAFRKTLTGVLLLGSVFSLWHIVVYWVAIAVAAGIDSRFLRRQRATG